MTKNAKNYIGFLNDYSGSMSGLQQAAIKDYNANTDAVKEAATKNMQDTVVSMFGFGGTVTKEVVNSNPHVLKPLTSWKAQGGTPMRSAIKQMIDMFKALPDYHNPEVSFVILATTDGEATYDGVTTEDIASEIKSLTQSERWTFVFRVPRGGRRALDGYNIPEGNIQEWDTTVAGMAASTQATTQAIDNFYAARSAGKRGSSVFYADASQVSVKDVKKTLINISGETSLYVVPAHQNGIEIRDFIHTKRSVYLKGAAFYQLTKTEARVSDKKLVAIRDRVTGDVYSGNEARDMIGMPKVGNARLHPGNHGNFDIFIQSESVNRKLVANTGVLYWEKIGVEFKPEDTAYLNGPVKGANGVVQLPKVAPTTKPTPSPLKPVAKAPAVQATPKFASREEARKYARANGKSLKDLGANQFPRWTVK